MSKYEDPTQLDYRYGGDTVDDFAQKYMKTVAYIFSALNELRSPTGGTLTQNPEAYQLKVDDNKLYIRNQANTDWILLGDVQENFGFRTSAADAFMHESDVADSGKAGKLIRADASGKLNADILGNAAKIADKAIQMGLDLADEDRLVYDKDTDTITNRPLQFKVDGDKIYARKDATTGWVLLGDLKQNLGFRDSTDDAFLTESDVADNGTAGKLIRADVNGKLNADILGNARKMAGKTFAPEDLQDGQIPVYRTSDGTWHAENKGTVGAGKNLMIMDGDKMLGEYNGDEMKAIDIQKSSLAKALAESTGYGIVSGCDLSIDGMTVTMASGVVHTSKGCRVEIAKQSMTLDAADATKPRTDLVYIDADGTVQVLKGDLGTAAVAGSCTFTLTTNFAANDTVTFGGVTITATTSTQDASHFIVGSDIATSMANLATAYTASTLGKVYTFSASGAACAVTEKTAGNGNTPGDMTISGTGVISAGTATTSAAEVTTPKALPTGTIQAGTIYVPATAPVIPCVIIHVKQMISQSLGIVNVKDFGAVGDGVTDDTNAMQEAFSVAEEKSETCIIPAGNYKLRSGIEITAKSTLRIIGDVKFIFSISDDLISGIIIRGVSDAEIRNRSIINACDGTLMIINANDETKKYEGYHGTAITLMGDSGSIAHISLDNIHFNFFHSAIVVDKNNIYLNNFNHLYFEWNDIAVYLFPSYSGKNTGENNIFNQCVFANGKIGIYADKSIGLDTFNQCSWDYLLYAFCFSPDADTNTHIHINGGYYESGREGCYFIYRNSGTNGNGHFIIENLRISRYGNQHHLFSNAGLNISLKDCSYQMDGQLYSEYPFLSKVKVKYSHIMPAKYGTRPATSVFNNAIGSYGECTTDSTELEKKSGTDLQIGNWTLISDVDALISIDSEDFFGKTLKVVTCKLADKSSQANIKIETDYIPFLPREDGETIYLYYGTSATYAVWRHLTLYEYDENKNRISSNESSYIYPASTNKDYVGLDKNDFPAVPAFRTLNLKTRYIRIAVTGTCGFTKDSIIKFKYIHVERE